MKKIFFYLVFALVILLVASCGEKPADPEDKPIPQTAKVEKETKPAEPPCELTMGWDPWEPYQYLTPDNQVRGLEIDLISSMAKEVNCSIRFVQNDWMNLLRGIRSGSIDLLGGASKTNSREEFAYFSEPYRHESFILYVNPETNQDLNGTTLIQLLENKFRLGVTEDYIYGDAVSDIQDNPNFSEQIISVPITEVNYYNLIQNQIDGFLEDPFVAGYTIKRKGLVGQIVASPISVHSGDVSIMFSRVSVNAEVVDAFNKALISIKESGEYETILNKYSH